VPLEDVLALSFALGVSPLHMVVPFDPDKRVVVASNAGEGQWKPGMTTDVIRQWLRGEEPLPGQDEQVFFSEVPSAEIRRLYRIAREAGFDLATLVRQFGIHPSALDQVDQEEEEQ
jgi:hypothetical protein